MLMIEKSDAGIAVKISGDSDDILTELFLLVENVDRVLEHDVYASLCNPKKINATKKYVDRLYANEQAKEPERKTDGAESKE